LVEITAADAVNITSVINARSNAHTSEVFLMRQYVSIESIRLFYDVFKAFRINAVFKRPAGVKVKG